MFPPFTDLTIYMFSHLYNLNFKSIEQNLVWWNRRYCIYYPCLEIFIYFTIIIGFANCWYYPHSFASIIGTPANPTPLHFMCGFISVCSVKIMAYQKQLSKRCLKVLIRKNVQNNQGSGRDFITGITSQKMIVKLIDPWYVFFCRICIIKTWT